MALSVQTLIAFRERIAPIIREPSVNKASPAPLVEEGVQSLNPAFPGVDCADHLLAWELHCFSQ